MTLEECRDALSKILDRPVRYNGQRIEIDFELDERPMTVMAMARKALETIKSKCA